MGNLSSSCRMSNHSRRNVRVFVTQKAVQLDAFVAARPGGRGELISPSAPDELSVVPVDNRRFVFRPDVACVRVLASQTRPLPGDARHFLSVFVEDEDDEDVCSKQIMHNMALSGPVTFLLYDV